MSKSVIDSFLEKIQNQKESIFPIDSPHTGKAYNWKKYYKTVDETEGIDPSFQDKKRIMIDFDGVIHSYDNGWQNGKIYGSVIKGTKEAINHLKESGYEIIIFTTRASESHNKDPKSEELVSELKSWLNKNNIYFDKITSEKLGAIAYIDDRAIRFENNWNDIIKKINTLKES
jgi:hypothetical protein